MLSQIEGKLTEMEQGNQKFADELEYRKADEKSFIEDQEQSRQQHEEH